MATTTEFYKLFNHNPTTETPTIASSFQQLLGGNHQFHHDYDRDFYHLRQLPEGYIGGVFRKVRTDEQIEIGRIGNDGVFVDFDQGQGKFENNPFVYFPQYDVIGYMRNTHANHPSRLEQCLTEAFARTVRLSPLLTQESIQALLQNRHLVKLNCSIPVTPNLINNGGQWGANAIQSLARSGADVVEFDVRVDLRRNDRQGLSNAVETIQEVLGMGATKLMAKTEDIDGNHELINLIADKIIHTDETFSHVRERATPEYLYSKIVDAYMSKLDDIEQTQRTN